MQTKTRRILNSLLLFVTLLTTSSASIMLKYAVQEKENVVNNIIGAQIRIVF